LQNELEMSVGGEIGTELKEKEINLVAYFFKGEISEKKTDKRGTDRSQSGNGVTAHRKLREKTSKQNTKNKHSHLNIHSKLPPSTSWN
jgi:hypothetical protein